jgi:hypothetical protein
MLVYKTTTSVRQTGTRLRTQWYTAVCTWALAQVLQIASVAQRAANRQLAHPICRPEYLTAARASQAGRSTHSRSAVRAMLLAARARERLGEVGIDRIWTRGDSPPPPSGGRPMRTRLAFVRS